jgi:hypothetical protein
LGGKVADAIGLETGSGVSVPDATVILNPDRMIRRAFRRSNGEISRGRNIMISTIREEVIHTAHIKALRNLWELRRRPGGDFARFFDSQVLGMVDEIAGLRDTLRNGGRFDKLRTLDDAIESSWELYGGRYQNAGEIIDVLSADSSKSKQLQFGVELVRQIVELNRDGGLTNDTYYKQITQRLTPWLRQVLLALQNAWA